MKKPLFSIVCPTYNSSGFIQKTLESVLAQTSLDYELIISDDGSKDNTVLIIKKLIEQHPETRINLLENSHLGPGAARNAGVNMAKGEWIAFLDSDDLWEPSKLEVVTRVIQKENEKVNFICHNELYKRLDGSMLTLDYFKRYQPSQPMVRQLYCNNFFSTSAVVCKAELLGSGEAKFDEGLSSAQDYDLWLQLANSIQPYFISERLGCYIERTDNISSTRPWKRWKNMLRVYYRYKASVGYRLWLKMLMKITAIFILLVIKKVIKNFKVSER